MNERELACSPVLILLQAIEVLASSHLCQCSGHLLADPPPPPRSLIPRGVFAESLRPTCLARSRSRTGEEWSDLLSRSDSKLRNLHIYLFIFFRAGKSSKHLQSKVTHAAKI